MDPSTGYVNPHHLQMSARLLNQAKQRSYAQMQIVWGSRVLDVGCGEGIDTLELARMAGPTGSVTGVDFDPKMIALAREHARQSEVRERLTHRHADATALPFPPDGFDAARAERLFQHLPHPEQALAEMIRVTRPGGRIVVLDTDWGSLSIDADENDIERRLARFIAESRRINGYSARRLYRLFKLEGLANVEVEVLPQFVLSYTMARQIAALDDAEAEAVAARVLTAYEASRWRAGLEKADSQGMFFASLNLVLVGACKPG